MIDQPNVFDDVTESPCMVCLELATRGIIQPRAVLPLPLFPPRMKSDNRQCCRDCQATETTMQLIGQHPHFGPARLTIANDRCEGLTMPVGMMQHFGFCKLGFIRPCSYEDLDKHLQWLELVGIPPWAGVGEFELKRP